ncbi:ROK family protein [Curtobacterium sp. MCLR17_036]|uniref:ROK family protein n=1 Tax=Curtobacterium sp. MCLR17_036 TaxID=2175620 RepID=UPI001C6517B0|nr:ROK family protein [Curtobacterium sp. MCLR17_036]WIE64342.1 ROK family protein [Curtobacterium sp. MCLR17_036]
MTTALPTGAPVGVMDVGGSHVTAALVDPATVGALEREAGSAVDPHAPVDVLLDQLVAPARSLLSTVPPMGWAVAMPGPFDYAAGTGTFAGVEKFRSLAGVDLRRALAERLDVAPEDVRFCNDAVAYGIGEWAAGSGARAPRMVCITLGTGVGSAFLHDGVEVSTGDRVPEEGEVHRLTIDGRPLEATFSSPALRDAYRAAAGRDRTVEELCALARQGDRLAAEVVDRAARALGTALRPWVERFAADRVVVGGSIARSWDVVGGPLRDTIAPDTRADDGPVVAALLGTRAPLVGAAVAWARAAGHDGR